MYSFSLSSFSLFLPANCPAASLHSRFLLFCAFLSSPFFVCVDFVPETGRQTDTVGSREFTLQDEDEIHLIISRTLTNSLTLHLLSSRLPRFCAFVCIHFIYPFSLFIRFHKFCCYFEKEEKKKLFESLCLLNHKTHTHTD